MAEEEKKDGKKRDTDEEILKEVRERVEYHDTVDNENRDNARSDTEFVWVKGQQWPDKIRVERDGSDRPWLEINQLPQFISQVVNDQRMGRPGIRINPASGEASDKVAEILQGMIRHIEYQSNAEAAYDSGFAHAVTGGRGYWRVCSEYEYAKSFDQCLTIKRVPDPQSVRIDPDYQDPDAGDINWAVVTELVQKDEFQRRWPGADAVSFDASTSDLALWYDGADKVVVADYYRRVTRKRKLVAMSDGTVGWKDDMPALPEGISILREREAEDFAVEWYKVAGGEQILEVYEWPGKFIPVVMCVGDEITVDGKRLFQGLIRRARDVQMMYNFWQTAATELIALAPRSPWVAANGQLEGFEQDWEASNKKNIAVLEYNPISAGGTVLAAPQRTQFAGIPTGIVEQANQCKQDLRATIGIYDPSLGKQSNETSGRAIIAREKQGDTATYHFIDNLTRAIALTGRILVDLIPHYYDSQRMVGMIDEEEERSMIEVNKRVPNPADFGRVIIENDLSMGRFAVTVEAGPNYATKRQEAADSMMQFIQAYPPAAQVAGDLMAKAMDWPGSEQIAERLKLLLPPQITQAEAAKEQGQTPIPPEAQQQMAQMGQQLQQMQAMLQQLGQENQQLKSGAQEKIASAQAQAQADQQIAEQDLEAKDRQAQMELATKARQQQRELEANEARVAAELASKERIARLASETQVIIAAMKGGPAPGANGAPPTGVPGGEGKDGTAVAPEPAQQLQLGEAMLLLAQSFQQMQQAAAAPRQSRLIMDEQGNPVGAVHEPMPPTMQ